MNILYWSSTAVISLFLLLSAYTYFFSAGVVQGFRDLGFPDFFRIQLAVMKIIAAVGILVPGLPLFLKEWSYAGILFFLITALVAHIAHKDSPALSVILVVLMAVWGLSYWSMQKIG